MRWFPVLAMVALAVGGCSRTASLNMVNGNAFLLGDDSCARYKAVSPEALQCFTAEGRPSGMRRAMTQQEVQVYYLERQLRAQQMAELNASMQQLAASSAQLSQVRYPTYTAPTVTPIAPPGGNRVSCITAGIYTSCR